MSGACTPPLTDVRTLAVARRWRYAFPMGLPLHVVTTEALALDPADRLRLAGELLDSVEGPVDPAWASKWTAELQRRSAAADSREASGAARGSAWSDVRERLLSGLARK
jgi:hypothetical protein